MRHARLSRTTAVLAVVGILVLLVPAAAPSLADLADSAWPMFRADLVHSGRSPYVGPQAPGTVWAFTTPTDEVHASPVIGRDGTLYVGSFDKNLYAVNPDGTEKWRYTTGGRITGAAAIDRDGTIYVGSHDTAGLGGNLYALRPDGTLKWTYPMGQGIKGSPAIGPTGTIYVGSEEWRIYALDPDGNLLWWTILHGVVRSSPAIGPDGVIYVGDSGHYLTALNPDGSVRWDYLATGHVITAPSVGSGRTIYFGSGNESSLATDYVYALRDDTTTATELWRYPTGAHADVDSSPAIADDGTVYVGALDGNLYAIRPDGTLRWSVALGSNGVSGSPAVDDDGTIYVGDENALFHAVRPDGTIKWSWNEAGFSRFRSSPAIGANGLIYVGNKNGSLYAFGDLLPVQIDIKPRNDRNSVNPRDAGVLAVAVLTTNTFDALTVDGDTVAFGPAGAAPAHRRAGHAVDVDADGDLDLLFHFPTRETGIVCGDGAASLSGLTYAGQSLAGTDTLTTRGCR